MTYKIFRLPSPIRLPTLISVLALSVSLTVTSLSTAQERLTPQQRIEKSATTEIWEPQPRLVNPGDQNSPPSDAVVLFDGNDLAQWTPVREDSAGWDIENGTMVVKPGTGDVRTKQSFGDVQLHIEWRTPSVVVGDSQNRGNSGIFFMERYEVQVLDSFDNPTYSNGQASSIYKQHIPLVNASRGPGQWQTYDIVFMAPIFGRDGVVKRPASATVFHNGILVQNNVILHGPTEYIGEPLYVEHSKAPIQLQDHGAPVAYRNIWLREL